MEEVEGKKAWKRLVGTKRAWNLKVTLRNLYLMVDNEELLKCWNGKWHELKCTLERP